MGANYTTTNVSVRVAGEVTSIAGANAQQAGVMTAEQAADLDKLLEWYGSVVAGKEPAPEVRATTPSLQPFDPSSIKWPHEDSIGEILGRLDRVEGRVGDLEARKPEQLPAPVQSSVVTVPAFEASRVAQVEGRVTELAALIDELRDRPTFTGADLESLRAAVSSRIREVVRDEVKLVVSEQAITAEVRELRERIERADSPSELMKAVSKLTADSAEIAEILHGEIMRLRESVAGMEQNFRDHIDGIEAEFHQHLAGGLQAAHDAIRAQSEYRASTRIQRSA